MISPDLEIFPLETSTKMALNTKFIQLEKPVIGMLAEDFQFKRWQREPSKCPLTSLPAKEGSTLQKAQSPVAGEQLNMALRLDSGRTGVPSACATRS
jgi:hypothetical protein